jgi:N-acetyl-gamma-glutamyl-phosphate reductase
MKKKIFIDGKAGTTGLRIYERLEMREDIEIILLSDDDRKDPAARKNALNSCDIAFLCLPDDAARESVSMIENENVTVIDTSTAHRTLDGWCYGFPELSDELAEKIKTSKRIAVPGCHASGFIALVKPLIDADFIDANELLTCHSITGYSGGGKKMIADYESEERDALLDAPRQYAITQQHKHLKEMKAITGLENAPIFCPIVSDFYSGMMVTVPLFASQLRNGKTVSDVKKLYADKYNTELVSYKESVDEAGFVAATAYAAKDTMTVSVAGNEERILLIALYDNLGKGASGAAVECMNIALGANKTQGLDI